MGRGGAAQGLPTDLRRAVEGPGAKEDQRRLTAADAPEGWLPLKGAARALGVSQKTVLQKLSSGELEGVRVRTGRRTGWRIRVQATTCDQEATLFGPGDIRGDAS